MAKRGPKPKTVTNTPQSKAAPASDAWAGVKPPDYLDAVGKAAYARMVAVLTVQGTLARTAPAMVEIYAAAYSVLRQALAVLDADGMTEQSAQGATVAHPMLATVATFSASIRGILNDLGLTPKTAKFSNPVAGAKSSKWAGLLKVVAPE